MSGERSGGHSVERHLRVARSARYWTLGDPSAAPDDIWFVLHGYGQLARRFLRRFTVLGRESRLIVAPEALSRFYIGSGEGLHASGATVGATWMTREDREAEIRDYVEYLDALAAAVVNRRARVTVLGFSQGVATAWRWITYGSVSGLERLVGWAGTVPPELDMDRAARALERAELLLVSGERDRTVPPEATEEGIGRLERAGIAYRWVLHSGGHEIDEETLLGIAR